MMNEASNIDFSNTQKAFSGKENDQLKFSYWLFKLMGTPTLVKMLSKFTVFAFRIGLPLKAFIKPTIFRQFCGGESLKESESVVKKLEKLHIGAILDYSVEGKERDEDFENTKSELLRIINLAGRNKSIPYTSIKLTAIARFGLLEKISDKKELDDKEQGEWNQVMNRLNDICHNCYVSGVPIYIDAEESWIQGAIDELAEEMMKRYNARTAVVQTTLQMYRSDRIEYLKRLINMARSIPVFIGVKLVRGAYWEKERERARSRNYKCPVHTSKMDTDFDFNEAVDICLDNIDVVSLCAGTHNEFSTMHLLKKMKELGVANNDKRVYCSQLYGMSDHITYNLADAGYNVTKYLPYGPVKSVIPYLVRRAEENTSIAGQMSRELKLIDEERKRRNAIKLLNR